MARAGKEVSYIIGDIIDVKPYEAQNMVDEGSAEWVEGKKPTIKKTVIDKTTSRRRKK